MYGVLGYQYRKKNNKGGSMKRYCELILAIAKRMKKTGIIKTYNYFLTSEENREFDTLQDRYGWMPTEKAREIIEGGRR